MPTETVKPQTPTEAAIQGLRHAVAHAVFRVHEEGLVEGRKLGTQDALQEIRSLQKKTLQCLEARRERLADLGRRKGFLAGVDSQNLSCRVQTERVLDLWIGGERPDDKDLRDVITGLARVEARWEILKEIEASLSR